jgi:adenosine deaminase
VARVEDHPVRRLYDACVPITLNSDDPAMFGCTLTDEYRLAARHFGFSESELRGIAENGFRYAFRGESVAPLLTPAPRTTPQSVP